MKNINYLAIIYIVTSIEILSCKNEVPIQSLEQYSNVILDAFKTNEFKTLDPILLDMKDTANYKEDIFKKGQYERDDIVLFISDKKNLKEYSELSKKRFENASREFTKIGINRDSISLEIIRLRGTFGGENGNYRSGGELVFSSL